MSDWSVLMPASAIHSWMQSKTNREVVYQPDGTALVTVTVGIGPGSFGFVSD